MRRADREVRQFKQMLEILDACDCCRLGLIDDGYAYIVPLNFGYDVHGEALTLFFHGACEGKKLDLLRAQHTASFEMDTKHALVPGQSPCQYSYSYRSIMGRGSVRILKDSAEKIHGLSRIIERYALADKWTFPEKAVDSTAVIALTVTDWSCKSHSK